MIPEIEFRYSWIYAKRLAFYTYYPKNVPNNVEKNIDNYYHKSKKTIKNLNKIWSKKGDQILKKIQQVSGFKWKEKKIIVYLAPVKGAFSDPLTMSSRIAEKPKDAIDLLTHELLHQIQSQNSEKVDNNYYKRHIRKKYKKEIITTQNHIFLHAAHKKIYLELIGEDRLNNDIKKCQKAPGYKRAWEIVEEEGYENILNQFKKLTK